MCVAPSAPRPSLLDPLLSLLSLDTMEPIKKAPLAEETQIHRIRITLSSLNVKNLEKG